MAQRLIVIVLLLLSTVVAGGPARAQEQELVFKKVAVFPFAVTSKESLGYLGEKISQEIRDRLKTDGFTPDFPGRPAKGTLPADRPRG